MRNSVMILFSAGLLAVVQLLASTVSAQEVVFTEVSKKQEPAVDKTAVSAIAAGATKYEEVLQNMDLNPPIIEHVPANKAERGREVVITATVKDDNGVQSVNLYYRESTQGNFFKMPMTPLQALQSYMASVPTADDSSVLEYYIEAADVAANRVLAGNPAKPMELNLLQARRVVKPETEAVATRSNGNRSALYALGGIALAGILISLAGGSGDNPEEGPMVGPESLNTVPLTFSIATP